MLLRPALRPPLSCSSRTHTLGLNLCQTTPRTFSTSPTALFSRRILLQQPQHTTRASTIPLRRHPLLLTTLTASALSIPYLTSIRTPTLHDSSPDFSTSGYSHAKDAKVPLSKDGGKSLNPRAIRQISMGSLMGLGLGIVVSAFSKMLVLLLGVGIVVTQYAARRGIYLVPVDKIQRYVKGVNLRSALNDNAAFKMSFGLMFALTAFGDF